MCGTDLRRSPLKPFLHPRHHPYIYILLYHLHHVVYMMIIVIVCVMYKMMIIMRILLLSLIRLPGYAGTRPPWDSQSLHIYPNIIIMKTYMFNVNIEKCTCHILIKSRRFSDAFSACWARVILFSSIKGSLHLPKRMDLRKRKTTTTTMRRTRSTRTRV